MSSFLFIFLSLTILNADSILALKCYEYSKDVVDFSKYPIEKECAKESECIYAKCQDPDGNVLGPKYKMGCTKLDDKSTTCKQFERECKFANGTSHCYRCKSHDLCNDGKNPPMIRCYNFNAEIANKLDNQDGGNSTISPIKYIRHLTYEDYERLKHLEGGIGTTYCPMIENMQCVNFKCKIHGKVGKNGNNWISVYKGCHEKDKLKEICEEKYKICKKHNMACEKECSGCQYDLCNGILANQFFPFWICLIMAAFSVFIAKFMAYGH